MATHPHGEYYADIQATREPEVFDVSDNLQGFGDGPVVPIGRIEDGFGNYPDPQDAYVSLLRAEAARVGVTLPQGNTAAVKYAARAALESEQ